MDSSVLQAAPPQTEPRRKALQFCPHCGYENPITGDWIVIEAATYSRVECPACGGTVLTQPTL